MSAFFSETAVDSTALGRGGALQWPEAARELARVTARAEATERVVTGGDRACWWLIALGWIGVTASFWIWWLHQAVHGTPWLYWPQTLAQLYLTTALPTFFFYYVYKMRRPVEVPLPSRDTCRDDHALRSRSRVAGRDSASSSRRSHGVRYEHDSWVLDEGASPDVRGPGRGTRRPLLHAQWRRPLEPAAAPFQTKTKAGNVNAWLDAFGDRARLRLSSSSTSTTAPSRLPRPGAGISSATPGRLGAGPERLRKPRKLDGPGLGRAGLSSRARSRWVSSARTGPRSSSAATYLRHGRDPGDRRLPAHPR